MALTPLWPAAGGFIGPGARMTWNNPVVGPVPIDDWLFCQIVDPVTTQVCLSTVQVAEANHNVSLTLGRMQHSPQLYRANDALLAYGAVVLVTCQWFHANGVLVDSFAGGPTWLWDPVSGLGNLVQSYHLSGSSSGDLAEILAAVKKTY